MHDATDREEEWGKERKDKREGEEEWGRAVEVAECIAWPARLTVFPAGMIFPNDLYVTHSSKKHTWSFQEYAG